MVCDVMCAAPLCRSLQKEPKERGDLPLLLVSSGLSWLGWVWNGLAHMICRVCGGGRHGCGWKGGFGSCHSLIHLRDDICHLVSSMLF